MTGPEDGRQRSDDRGRRYWLLVKTGFQVQAAPLAGSGQFEFDRRGKFLVSEYRLKKLWERFVTAMNLAGLPSKIVVKNHSHRS
jgi:hypothetical protein